MTCLALTARVPLAAQPPKQLAVSVGFTNRTDMPVIVKGYTIVNKVQRGGPTLQIDKSGGQSFETNVPANNFRYYTIYDANYNILLRNHPIAIQNRNVLLDIVPNPLNPKQVNLIVVQGK
jgi:hypothetical protein